MVENISGRKSAKENNKEKTMNWPEAITLSTLFISIAIVISTCMIYVPE